MVRLNGGFGGLDRTFLLPGRNLLNRRRYRFRIRPWHRLFSDKLHFVLFFDGSIKGLSVGSPVVSRGVRVGSVSDISLHVDSKNFTTLTPVIIEVDATRVHWGGRGREPKFEEWIENGFSAQLELLSLVTGQLMVDLDLRKGKTAKFTENEIDLPQIPTVRTPLQELADE